MLEVDKSQKRTFATPAIFRPYIKHKEHTVLTGIGQGHDIEKGVLGKVYFRNCEQYNIKKVIPWAHLYELET